MTRNDGREPAGVASSFLFAAMAAIHVPTHAAPVERIEPDDERPEEER